jgi:hypothetical protein
MNGYSTVAPLALIVARRRQVDFGARDGAGRLSGSYI